MRNGAPKAGDAPGDTEIQPRHFDALDAKTLEQSPAISLRGSALPLPPRLPDRELAPLSVLHTLGEGGMGVVRLALQRSLHREVAVKTVRSDGSEHMRRALISEALVAGALQHPNIIPIYAIDEDDSGAPVIVMKRVEGVSWHAILHGEAELPADAEDALDWHLEVLTQVAGAVTFAHRRGILHRDLKPENVMIGELGEVYLLDWGLGVSTREADRGVLPLASDVRGISGTPSYMAPEMLEGTGEALGQHTDVYLLGATLHEILVGAPRHLGATVMQVVTHVALSAPFAYPADVPAELGSIANRACARDPAERFASAEAFRGAILAFRRHRSSLRLSDRAAARLDDLRGLVSAERDVPEHQRQVRDLFGAARFGFEQAVEAWPENAAARQGMRDVLETIVRFEVLQRNAAAARAYLEALADPPAALAEDVRALELELERQREEVGKLRRQARDSDRALGARGRAIAGVVFGVGAAGSLLMMQWAHDTGLSLLNTRSYLQWLVWLVSLTSVVVLVFRRVLFSNRVNREILVGTSASMIAIIALRLVVVWSGLSVYIGFRVELIVYGMALAMLAIISNRRALVAAAVFTAGSMIDALLDRRDLYVAAATVFVGFAALSWAWASVARKRRRPEGSEGA